MTLMVYILFLVKKKIIDKLDISISNAIEYKPINKVRGENAALW